MTILDYAILLVLALAFVGIVAHALWDLAGRGRRWRDDE